MEPREIKGLIYEAQKAEIADVKFVVPSGLLRGHERASGLLRQSCC